MAIQEIQAEEFARLFNHYSRALSLSVDETPVEDDWVGMPQSQKDRIVAAVRLTLEELECSMNLEQWRRKYFPKPGEAEWGC